MSGFPTRSTSTCRAPSVWHFADAFDVRLVEQTSARWEFWFGLLERYADENGTARVPVDYVIGGYPLGQWASVQRGFYTKGTLSEDRQEEAGESARLDVEYPG